MPRFMLDTDTCSYIMKRSQPLVLKRLQAVPVGDVCMSVRYLAEPSFFLAIVDPCHDSRRKRTGTAGDPRRLRTRRIASSTTSSSLPTSSERNRRTK